MVFYIVLLFAAAGIGGALLVFPGWRAAVLRKARHRVRQLRLRHALTLQACALLLCGPPLAVLLATGADPALEPEAPRRPVDTQIAQVLDGEHLAPPEALPPMAFTTAEVRLVRPMLGGASRDWGRLDADFSQRLLLVFRIMREQHGYEMALLEGYRSPERQDQLAAAGPHVTGARAFQSYHQYGLAADCAFLRDGKLVISERDPWAMRGYRLYGEAAEAAGLHWGGRWTMLDFGHVESHRERQVRN